MILICSCTSFSWLVIWVWLELCTFCNELIRCVHTYGKMLYSLLLKRADMKKKSSRIT